MTDDPERRLRSLLLALASHLRPTTPLGLQDAVWRETGDELLPGHRRIVGSPGPTVH